MRESAVLDFRKQLDCGPFVIRKQLDCGPFVIRKIKETEDERCSAIALTCHLSRVISVLLETTPPHIKYTAKYTRDGVDVVKIVRQQLRQGIVSLTCGGVYKWGYISATSGRNMRCTFI